MSSWLIAGLALALDYNAGNAPRIRRGSLGTREQRPGILLTPKKSEAHGQSFAEQFLFSGGRTQNPDSGGTRRLFLEIRGRGSGFRTKRLCYFCDLPKSFQLNNTIRGSSSDGDSSSSAGIRTRNGKTLATPSDRRGRSTCHARADECRHLPRSRFRTELRRDVGVWQG
jgi:hypothetical protein